MKFLPHSVHVATVWTTGPLRPRPKVSSPPVRPVFAQLEPEGLGSGAKLFYGLHPCLRHIFPQHRPVKTHCYSGSKAWHPAKR